MSHFVSDGERFDGERFDGERFDGERFDGERFDRLFEMRAGNGGGDSRGPRAALRLAAGRSPSHGTQSHFTASSHGGSTLGPGRQLHRGGTT
ncbi:MAG: hypothetical protein M0Z69_14035 [Actinomycetota bacterium]|nr:hypothetical protein [Actinomycetota bacterium]